MSDQRSDGAKERVRNTQLNVDLISAQRFDALAWLQERWGCASQAETVRRGLDRLVELEREKEAREAIKAHGAVPGPQAGPYKGFARLK